MKKQHELFVQEFLVDYRASRAYQRAGYRARGHSAEANASRLRKRPDVAAAIEHGFRLQLKEIAAHDRREQAARDRDDRLSRSRTAQR